MPEREVEKLRDELFRRLDGYSYEVRRVFYDIIDKIAGAVSKVEYTFNPDKPFAFDDYPEISKQVNDLLRDFHKRLYAVTKKGIEKEWETANRESDKLVKEMFGEDALKIAAFSHMFNNNTDALQRFFKRKMPDGSRNLSQRIWNIEGQLRQDLELTLDTCIGKGMSADNISRKIREYLHEPERLFRRVRNEKGELVLSENAKACHPGQGVYRSSYKNAMRVARTETKAAYHSSNSSRWQQLGSVIGIEIRRSNHPYECDVCASLAGVYPKTFLWTGWHPQCRCYDIPVMIPREEQDRMKELILKGEDTSAITKKYEVKDFPQGFKDWMAENVDRIERANNRGTLPHWIKNNAGTLKIDVKGINTQSLKYNIVEASRQKFAKYDDSAWKKEYFDPHSGGYNVYHKEHQFSKVGGGGDAEMKVGRMLAKYNGKQVEFLPENGKGKGVPDFQFDGQTWDVKYIQNANVETIRKYIKDARKAENVILYGVDKYNDALDAAKRETGRFEKSGRLDELPNMYFIDEDGLLKLIKKTKG
jgi:hypothetical protein